MPKKTSFIFLLLLFCMAARSQSLPADSALQRLFETDVLLPVLIDSAIKNSAQLHRADNAIQLYEESIKTNKKSILSGISFFSNYSYGDVSDLNYGKDYNATNQFSNYRTTTSARYQLGVNVQVPLTGILLRKNQIHSAELQVKVAEDEKDNLALFVKQEVIKYYQDLKLSHKLLVITGNSKQVAYSNFSMTQKDFLKGNGDLDQLSRIQNIYSKCSVEYETAFNHFQTTFLMLQSYAGVELAKLINRFK